MVRLKIIGRRLVARRKPRHHGFGPYITEGSGNTSTAPLRFGDDVKAPPETDVEKRLMNVRELSEYLGTSKGSLYEKIFKGKIPDACIVKMGRSVRFDRKAIDGWIDSQKLSARSCQPFR